MKFKRYLTEKYDSRVGKTEVFVNPSFKELMQLTDRGTEEIRFTALHNKKKVWIWNAYMADHGTIEPKLQVGDPDKNPNLLSGEAEPEKLRKWIITNSDLIHYSKVRNEVLSKDWKWLEKYHIYPMDWIKRARAKWKL